MLSLLHKVSAVFLPDRAIVGFRVAFREGPQNNRERANLALYFTRLNAGLAQA